MNSEIKFGSPEASEAEVGGGLKETIGSLPQKDLEEVRKLMQTIKKSV